MKTKKCGIYKITNKINGKQELADFLGIKHRTLESRLHKKQIDVTIIRKKIIE